MFWSILSQWGGGRHLLKGRTWPERGWSHGTPAVSLSTTAFLLEVQNASGVDHRIYHSLIKENGLLRFNFHLLGPSPEEILASSGISFFLNCNFIASTIQLQSLGSWSSCFFWEYEKRTIWKLAFLILQLAFRNTRPTQSSWPASLYKGSVFYSVAAEWPSSRRWALWANAGFVSFVLAAERLVVLGLSILGQVKNESSLKYVSENAFYLQGVLFPKCRPGHFWPLTAEGKVNCRQPELCGLGGNCCTGRTMCGQPKWEPSFQWAPVTAPSGRDGEKLGCRLFQWSPSWNSTEPILPLWIEWVWFHVVAVVRTFLKGCFTWWLGGDWAGAAGLSSSIQCLLINGSGNVGMFTEVCFLGGERMV